jgi:hypothetical protein
MDGAPARCGVIGRKGKGKDKGNCKGKDKDKGNCNCRCFVAG